MDREILFRGKGINNGNWMYGYYLKYTDIVGEVTAICPLPEERKYCHCYIDPATVGQFTGLCDKDGKKIFEGDILYKEGHWTFYVGYEMGAFRAIPLEPVQKLNWPHCTLEEFLRVGMGDCKGFKVVGNIHDNPELLKEEAE